MDGSAGMREEWLLALSARRLFSHLSYPPPKPQPILRDPFTLTLDPARAWRES